MNEDVTHLETLIRDGKTEEALALVARMKEAFNTKIPEGQALNPVTIRGVLTRGSADPVNITLGRLWLSEKDMRPPDSKPTTLSKLWQKGNDKAQQGQAEGIEKCFSVVVWCGPDKYPQPLATGIFDEDKIIEALRLLFPKGELMDKWILVQNALKNLLMGL